MSVGMVGEGLTHLLSLSIKQRCCPTQRWANIPVATNDCTAAGCFPIFICCLFLLYASEQCWLPNNKHRSNLKILFYEEGKAGNNFSLYYFI